MTLLLEVLGIMFSEHFLSPSHSHSKPLRGGCQRLVGRRIYPSSWKAEEKRPEETYLCQLVFMAVFTFNIIFVLFGYEFYNAIYFDRSWLQTKLGGETPGRVPEFQCPGGLSVSGLLPQAPPLAAAGHFPACSRKKRGSSSPM